MRKSYSTDHLLKVLRRRVDIGSLRSVARELEFSAPYIHDILNGRRQMSEELALRLGFTLIEMPPQTRRWKLTIGETCTTEWERKNWPQV
jgi:hypothetical protein